MDMVCMRVGVYLAGDCGDDVVLLCHAWQTEVCWEGGRRKGPLARGKLGVDEDALSEAALGLGVRRFLKTEAEGGNPDLRFSLVSLGPLFD